MNPESLTSFRYLYHCAINADPDCEALDWMIADLQQKLPVHHTHHRHTVGFHWTRIAGAYKLEAAGGNDGSYTRYWSPPAYATDITTAEALVNDLAPGAVLAITRIEGQWEAALEVGEVLVMEPASTPTLALLAAAFSYRMCKAMEAECAASSADD